MLVWRLQLGRRLRIWKRFWLHQRVLSFCIVRRICRSCFRRKSRVMRVGTYKCMRLFHYKFSLWLFLLRGFFCLGEPFYFLWGIFWFRGLSRDFIFSIFLFLFHGSEVFKRSALIVRRFLDIKIENRLNSSWDNAFLVTSLHTNHVCHDFAVVLEVVLCSARMSGSPSGARDFFDSESTALMLIAFIAESSISVPLASLTSILKWLQLSCFLILLMISTGKSKL
jgi:hypothetical protein